MATQIEPVAHQELVLGGPTAMHTHAGSLTQMVYYQTGAVQTATNPVIPYDDTIPQNTEGVQLLALAITPKRAANKLVITICCMVAIATGVSPFIVVGSLFQNANVNAIAAGSDILANTNVATSFILRHSMIAGVSGQAIIFSFRMGFSTSNHILTFNGSGGVRKMGGVMASSITIEEIVT
jgi:hypothetical protein